MKLAGMNDSLDIKLQMASLIDVVFLLLIYFMVTASLIRREGDISFMTPAPNNTIIEKLPIEALVEILPDGSVRLEGLHFSGADRTLPGLITQMSGLCEIAASQGAVFNVNLLPNQDTLHYQVIDVMDACAKAGVENLGFVKSIR